ncbi:MAG TPA: M48 family metallopeptidase [Terriglobales bacterium]|nr:M48 family metallopeptidase [Terriglobales bacterium]
MRNPSLCRQQSAHLKFSHTLDQKLKKLLRQSSAVLLASLLLIFCAPLWGQQPAPGVTTTATAVPPPLASDGPPGDNGVEPAAVKASKEPRPGKHLKLKHAEDDVSLIGQRNVGSGVNFYSLQKEQALGHQLAEQVESQSRLISDPVINEYVNRVGQAIVRHSDAKVPFTIKVLDDDQINAFALPGGYFYVDSGLIIAADSEAELAGVMAHEIAHVAARHATRNATRAQIFNLVSIPLIFVGGPVGYAVREVAGLAVPMSFLKFSRDAEREADLLGLQYEYAAGYDPQAFVRFFEKLKAGEKQHQGKLAKAFSTHPMTGDRIRRAQQEIATILPPQAEYVVDTSEFQEMKERLERDVEKHRPDAGGPPRLIRRDRKEKDKNDGGPVLRRKSSSLVSEQW